jgi:hypothetical protein
VSVEARGFASRPRGRFAFGTSALARASSAGPNPGAKETSANWTGVQAWPDASTLRRVLRRILWFVAGLLAVAIVAAAIVPRHTTKEGPPPAALPERATIKAAIGAAPAHVRTIPARVGDHLELTVESDRIDQVAISGIDEIQSVDATTPARFDTLLDHPGRFQVRMQQANTVVGVLDVKRR